MIINISPRNSEGLQHGLHKYYHGNGKLQAVGHFINNKQDGTWEYYFKNGKLKYLGDFRLGKISGYWVGYDSYGKKTYQEYYLED